MTDSSNELVEIRNELRFSWSYVDDELADQIAKWLIESYRRNDADTAREYVEHHLHRLLRKYPMYNSTDVAKGEEAFPSDCEKCPHYGAACPVLTDGIQDDWRARELADAETEKDARRVYEQQARDTGCVVIPELLETWDESISGFMQRGEALLLKTKETEDVDIEEADEEVEADEELDAGDVDDVLEEAGVDLDLDIGPNGELPATGEGEL